MDSNLKHIDGRHHFLRELIVRRFPLNFQHVCVDILTKALAYDLFAFHRKFLMNLK